MFVDVLNKVLRGISFISKSEKEILFVSAPFLDKFRFTQLLKIFRSVSKKKSVVDLDTSNKLSLTNKKFLKDISNLL